MSSDVCSYRNDPPEEDLVITHNGMAYIVNEDATRPEVEYLRDYKDPDKYNTLWYVYELRGAHLGPAIKVELENPRMEPGSYGGYYPDYDSVRWEDDKTKFDSDLWDCYGDAVQEDLKEMLTR